MSADILTTGQAAKLCGVATRTLIHWMEKGLLKGGYILPGTLHRRIPKANLVAFMREHGMPLDEVEKRCTHST